MHIKPRMKIQPLILVYFSGEVKKKSHIYVQTQSLNQIIKAYFWRTAAVSD